MKIRIDNYCIRCGICIDLYPEIYIRNFEEDCIDVIVDKVPSQLIQKAIDSACDCAVCAIKLRETVTDSGLRGRGGAGCLAGLKWKVASEEKSDIKYIKKCSAGVCKNLVKYIVNQNRCEGCSVCAASCPSKCITVRLDETKIIDNEVCVECGTCYNLCPVGAIYKE